MERVSDLYYEIECARFFGKTIDEWWEKPELAQTLMLEHYGLHVAKESYYNMDKEDQVFFFHGGRRKD